MLDFLQHIDTRLDRAVIEYGVLIYWILAGTIFLETAVVVFPFLPGDSLLFAVGVVAGRGSGSLSIPALFLLLSAAAIAGNVVNYWLGRFFGKRLFSNPKARFFSPSNLAKTHEFFENYGGKAIVITRFVPVIRAFAPFVAGMGAMEFGPFMIFNTIGGVAWVSVCMFMGVFLGEQPFIKHHPDVAILALVGISVLPMIFEYIMHHKRKRDKKSAQLEADEAETQKQKDQ